MCKHILNAQVAIRASCCKKWFDCAECHEELEEHPLKKTSEMVFACKKCTKVFRKDIIDYDEQDEYCPQQVQVVITTMSYKQLQRRRRRFRNLNNQLKKQNSEILQYKNITINEKGILQRLYHEDQVKVKTHYFSLISSNSSYHLSTIQPKKQPAFSINQLNTIDKNKIKHRKNSSLNLPIIKNDDQRVIQIDVQDLANSYHRSSFHYDDRLFKVGVKQINKKGEFSKKRMEQKQNIVLQLNRITTLPQISPKSSIVDQKIAIQMFLSKKFQQKKPKQNSILGSEQRINHNCEQFIERVSQDTILKTNEQQLEALKQIFIDILMTESSDSQQAIQFIKDSLIFVKTEQEFDQIKHLFTLQFYDMNIPSQELIRCALRIEQFRHLIIPETTLMLKFGGQEGLNRIGLVLFSKVFTDFTLRQFFKINQFDIPVIHKIPSQFAHKFSRHAYYILSTAESASFAQTILKSKHEKQNFKMDIYLRLQLNHVHFTNFKYHLYMSLHEMDYPKESIWELLEFMDAFKFAVMNHQDLKELIEKEIGFDRLIDQFVKYCSTDNHLKLMIQKDSPEKFKYHATAMFELLLNRMQLPFTITDLSKMHKGHQISPQIYDSLHRNAVYQIQKLHPNESVLENFMEDWEYLRPYIIGEKLAWQKLGGWDGVNKIGQNIAMQLGSIKQFDSLYRENDINASDLVCREMEFICSGRKYFKRSEVAQIHKRLKISNEMFDIYTQKLAISLKYLGIQNVGWLIDLVNSWREEIIFK